METTRLSTKGQIILPKKIRSAHSWEPGMEFTVEETAEGILLRPASQFPAVTVDDVFGCLKTKRKKPATLAEMDAAITEEIKARHARGRY
jgi:AbrB family looped-hinge helix DNA binding protein